MRGADKSGKWKEDLESWVQPHRSAGVVCVCVRGC